MNLPPISMLFLGYGTLFLIGLGPSIWLISRQQPRRIALAMCVAPVAGLAETGLIFYSLFLRDLLIIQTTYPVIFCTLALSISLVALDIRRNPGAYRHVVARRTAVFVGISFLITIGLLLFSAVFIGQEVQYWSANPFDAAGYITMAEYAKNVPISYSLSPEHYQDIIQINPALSSAFGNQLMIQRPAAPNTLAWLSTLYGIPIYSGYYFVKMLFLSLVFGITLAIGTQLKMPLRWRIACAVVLTVGFWTAFVFDIDAFSHLASISLNLLVLFTWLTLEQEAPIKLFSRQRVFLGLALASAMTFYPEMFMPLAGAVGFYYVLIIFHQFRDFNKDIRIISEIICTGFITILFSLPCLGAILGFMFQQAAFTITNRVAWENTYFPWLFQSGTPWRDFWGLHLLQTGRASALPLILTSLLGLALSIVLIWRGAQAVLQRRLSVEHRLLAAPAIVLGGTGLVFMLWRQQLWIAGKALSFAAPFVIIAVFFYVYSYARRGLPRIFQIALTVWVAIQIATPLLHALAWVKPGVYPRYSQLLNRTPIAKIAPVLDSLETRPPRTLGIDFADSTSHVAIAWSFAVADKAKFVALSGGADYFTVNPIWWQNSDAVPDQLLLSSKRDFLSAQHLGQVLVSDPSAFVLSAVTPNDLDQAVMYPSLTDPYQISAVMLTDTDQPYLMDGQVSPIRWTRQRSFPGEPNSGTPNPEQTLLRFWASGKTTFAVYLQYVPNFTGSLQITANGTLVEQHNLTSADEQQTVFCVGKSGINTIVLDYTVGKLLDVGRKDQRLLLQQVLFAANGKLNVGVRAEQLSLGAGWYGEERWDSSDVRWSNKDSQLTLVTCKTPSLLRFRAFARDGKSQSVTLTLNDTPLGTVALHSGWHEYSVPIPPGAYREKAKQNLKLSHDNAEVPPNDGRIIAAAYEWFVLD